MQYLSADDFLAWEWRVPFLASVPPIDLGPVAAYGSARPVSVHLTVLASRETHGDELAAQMVG